MPITVIAIVREYPPPPMPALCRITVSADNAMMYGTTFVTTARLTSAPNCEARSGEIVISASSVCTTPMMIMPVIGAPIEFALPKTLGNICVSAASFATDASVNCQPSSEPTHAMTASAMTIEPIVGLNIIANAVPNEPVDAASSALGTMPWMAVVDST